MKLFYFFILFASFNLNSQKAFSSSSWSMFVIQGDTKKQIASEEGINYLKVNKEETIYTLLSGEESLYYMIVNKEVDEDGDITYLLKDPNGKAKLIVFSLKNRSAVFAFDDEDGMEFMVRYENLKRID